jgi:hypothetical protein
MTVHAGGRVAFVVKGYPRLSETFIAQEILALEQRGLDILIVSLRHPTDPATHPVHGQIRAPVLYLPEYLKDEPRRVWRGLAAGRRLPGYRTAWRIWLKDLVTTTPTHPPASQGKGVGGRIADIEHAHFLHTPASVARYAATMREIDWSVSAQDV